MPEIVDPRPLIQERLRVLATEHEPRIAERQRAVDEGESGAKAELRRAKRSYAAARREVKNMRSRGAAW